MSRSMISTHFYQRYIKFYKFKPYKLHYTCIGKVKIVKMVD